MKTATSLFVGALLIGAGTLCAETLTFNKASDWNSKKPLAEKDGVISTGEKSFLIDSKKSFAIDPSKTYTFKISSKAENLKDPKQGPLSYFAIRLYDAKGRELNHMSVSCFPETVTTVVRDAKKGDKSIFVKDASKWVYKPWFYVNSGAKSDSSDLPNYNSVSGSTMSKIEKKGDAWEISFNKPLNIDIKAGTSVRVHSGGGFFYAGGAHKATGEWKTNTGVIKGFSEPGKGFFNIKMWPAQAKTGRITILVNWNKKDAQVSFKDVSLDIK